MTIAIVNESTLISAASAVAMVDACRSQVANHFAPSWSRMPSLPQLYTSRAHVPKGLPLIALVDDSDQADALGYHTEDTGGVISGIVAARPVLDGGGSTLTGELSVSSVLSHEVLETHVDPWVDVWVDARDGRSWAFEVCDPVQGDSYAIGGVSVSNFVGPSFFNAMPAPDDTFDYLGKLTAPFSLSAGGYAVVRSKSGHVSQIGERRAGAIALRTGKRRRALLSDGPLHSGR